MTAKHVHVWTHAPDWLPGKGRTTIECHRCNGLRFLVARCVFTPCVATWEHYHGGFPGGFDNPDDPTGVPISFVGPDPDPAAVRDYNGAALVQGGNR